MKTISRYVGIAIAVLICAASIAGSAAETLKPISEVDSQRIMAADSEPGHWMTTGRTYREQRFSPLLSIDTSNVARLGLAWTYKLDVDRGVEATPIVVDGVMYTTGPFSIVYALDPRTGALLWKYDPKVHREKAS